MQAQQTVTADSEHQRRHAQRWLDGITLSPKCAAERSQALPDDLPPGGRWTHHQNCRPPETHIRKMKREVIVASTKQVAPMLKKDHALPNGSSVFTGMLRRLLT